MAEPNRRLSGGALYGASKNLAPLKRLREVSPEMPPDGDTFHLVSGNSLAPEEVHQLDDQIFWSAVEKHYEDLLLDAWWSCLRNRKPPGELNIDLLRRGDLHHNSRLNLVRALVLWHDVKTILIESEPDLYYSACIREVVPEFEMRYKKTYSNFRGLKEPGDPLKLSHEQFCRLYHVHNEVNLPCYK
jgi:hypothetical protein